MLVKPRIYCDKCDTMMIEEIISEHGSYQFHCANPKCIKHLPLDKRDEK